MSKKCKAYSASKLGLEAPDNRKAFYKGWDAAINATDWLIIRDERFSQLVRDATLEEAAKLCDDRFSDGALVIADAIRALKGKQ